MDWNRTKQFFAAFWSAFPDLSAKIEEMVAEGDKVAIRVINTGIHKGEFQAILPTGKKVSFGGRDFITLRDGKIVEQRASVDMMELMQQIGAIPAPPTAGSNTAAHS
jgi:predicted ester cyclase